MNTPETQSGGSLKPVGSARSWTIDWTQRNGMKRTGHAATDLALIAVLTDIMERSEPRKITLKPNDQAHVQDS